MLDTPHNGRGIRIGDCHMLGRNRNRDWISRVNIPTWFSQRLRSLQLGATHGYPSPTTDTATVNVNSNISVAKTTWVCLCVRSNPNSDSVQKSCHAKHVTDWYRCHAHYGGVSTSTSDIYISSPISISTSAIYIYCQIYILPSDIHIY